MVFATNRFHDIETKSPFGWTMEGFHKKGRKMVMVSSFWPNYSFGLSILARRNEKKNTKINLALFLSHAISQKKKKKICKIWWERAPLFYLTLSHHPKTSLHKNSFSPFHWTDISPGFYFFTTYSRGLFIELCGFCL